MMRFFGLLLAFLFIASGAHAAPKHGVYSTGVACPYAKDNGCFNSTTYVAAPYFQDTNFAYNHAQSGQLPPDCVSPTSCTVNTNAIANLTALWHTDNANLPYWDYPIGSADPATLNAASTVNDSTCVYHASGAPFGGGPYIGCTQPTTSSGTYTLQNIDMTNTGTGTGSGCVELVLNGNTSANNTTGGGVTFILQNLYFKATTGSSCFLLNSGNHFAFIYAGAGGAYPIANIQILNCTFDGNFANATDAPQDNITGYISGTTLTLTSGSIAAAGEVLTGAGVTTGTSITTGSGSTWTVYPSQTVGSAGSPVAMVGHVNLQTGAIDAMKDNRRDNNNNYQWPKTVKYSLFINLGHNAFTSPASGDDKYYYNAFIDFCLSGRNVCHGEVFEDTGGNTYRNTDVVGNIVTIAAQQNINNSMSAAWYLSSGQANNVTYGTVNMTDNLIIYNKSNCANAGPFTPSNPCGSQGTGANTQVSGSLALFSTQQTNSINAFTVTGNVVDGQYSFNCYGRIANSAGVFTGATMGVLSAGQNFTVSTPSTNYTNPTSAVGIYPGMVIVDTNSTDITNGWIDATINSFTGATAPIFSNSGSACAVNGGAPGQPGGLGCGSMLVSQVEPVTAATVSQFYFVTGFNALTWSNNWSVGGNYGVTARALTNPGYGGPNNSWTVIACP